MNTDITRATEIATLNDDFRKGYMFMLTPGIRALSNVQQVVESVRAYDRFNEDNDPYGEHDFGSLECCGEKIFWKIDYYNISLQGWCDPLDNSCTRVLTIMLAEEY